MSLKIKLKADILEKVKKELKIRKARKSHLAFMQYCWQRNDPFFVGYHTNEICKVIDEAFKNFRNGISTHLCIKVPFRHGKSDIVSRFLPPHFLGEFPECETITAAYSAGLVRKFSRFSRNLFRSEQFRDLYPEIELSGEVANVDEWGLSNGIGLAQWMGIGGSITGAGGHLIVIDDFFKGREQAESEVIREKVWESITNDILTRAAPVHIIIILATPWHIDDPFARIQQEMQNNSKFPKYKEIKFPAISDNYESGFLFPERFTQDWYDGQKAQLGNYGAASLLQCDPSVRSGNFLKTDRVQFVDECPDDIEYVRAWDLASSEKQLAKDDPDWTIGVRAGIKYKQEHGFPVPILYIDDVIRVQQEAPARDKKIIEAARKENCRVGVEAFGGYKDAYNIVKDVLNGVRHVQKLQLMADKMSKASPLEAIFEAGNIYIKKAWWNEPFLNTLAQFPSGKHDDDVDALALAYHMLKGGGVDYSNVSLGIL